MRYTCFQKIITKVYDGILEDNASIVAILKELKQKEITCSLLISDVFYNEVRVLSVDDDGFSWRCCDKGASLKKVSTFAEIKTLEVVVSDRFVALIKPNASRWNTIDTSNL